MVLSIVLQVILALGFIYFGYLKFTSEDMVKGFEHFGYTDSFRIFTGIVEIVGALLLIIGIWIKPVAFIGALLLAITMIGAILTHIKIKDEFKNMIMPIILFILNVIVVSLNWTSVF